MWKAFLSGKVGGIGVNAPDRLDDVSPWVYAVNGQVAFANKAALSAATAIMGNGTLGCAWTGTNLGIYTGKACEGSSGDSWESESSNGTFGDTDIGSGQWWAYDSTHPNGYQCNFQCFLYCFEQ
jgi:hypothetical protein